LLKYLNFVKLWYQVFNDYPEYVSRSIEDRFKILTPAANFFNSLRSTGNRSIMALRRAPELLSNLTNLWKQVKWPAAKDGLRRLGHFGMNINENLFSQFRAKGRYLTLAAVFIISGRATAEFKVLQ